ncbi:MAG: lipopolysaccharide heptosyltransferase II, partial [Acidiferrobacter sp.]
MGASRALIVGPAWVGDMVMAHSLFQLLKARDPQRALDLIAPPATLSLATRMPEIAEAMVLAIPHGRLALRERLRLGRQLRERHYTQAYVLPRSYKSALPAWASGAQRRTAYLGEARFGLINDIRHEPAGAKLRTVERFLLLGLEPGEPLPEVPAPRLRADPEAGRRCAERFGIDLTMPLLALCPGAEYGPAKRWPARHFARLARTYHDRGWRVLVLGGPHDQEVARAIDTLSEGACANLTGQTTLLEAVDLMALATAVVSNDSGLMHVAASLHRPMVAVF